MSNLRAPDIKDEHGWQILNGDGRVVAHENSRDEARYIAKLGRLEGVKGEVLPPEDASADEIAAFHANKAHQRILTKIHSIKGAWVDLAGELYAFQQGKHYDALGYTSMNAYLMDPDVDIEPRMGYHWIAAYGQLVVERGVDPERLKSIGVSKLVIALPAVRREQVSVDEALADGESLTQRDMAIKYSGRASKNRGTPDTGTDIATDEEPTWAVCPTCGTRKQTDPRTGEFMR